MSSKLYITKQKVLTYKTVPIMLKFCQEILEKVSFDKILFQKELLKSINWLSMDEAKILKMWCVATFGHLYLDVITQAFNHVA